MTTTIRLCFLVISLLTTSFTLSPVSTYISITETGKYLKVTAEYNTGYTGDGDYENRLAQQWKKSNESYVQAILKHLEKNKTLLQKASGKQLTKYDPDLIIISEQQKDPAQFNTFRESEGANRPFLLQMWFYRVNFSESEKPASLTTDFEGELSPVIIQVPLKSLPKEKDQIDLLKTTIEELLLNVPAPNVSN